MDPDRVVLQGLSHGGWTVLRALNEQVASWADYLLGRKLRFAAGVAYYPYCPGSVEHEFYAPLLILIGEKDDWTPAQPCVDLHAFQRSQARTDIRLKIYPGAYHAYDYPFPPRQNALGKHLEFNASATRDSERQVDLFLKDFIK